MSLDTNSNQWSDLPKDILLLIVNYIDLNIDLPRIRGVCPNWRSAIPFPDFRTPKYQLEVPCLHDTSKSNRPLFLLESRLYFFSPYPNNGDHFTDCTNNKSWIARLVHTRLNKWHIINPVTNYHHDYLITDPPITGGINLLDCRVIELARPICLVERRGCELVTISNKVVGDWDLTSSNLSVVLALLDYRRGLIMLKSGDEEWSKIDVTCKDDELQESKFFKVVDIAFHKGKFYFFQLMCNPTGLWRIGIINADDCSKSWYFKCGSHIPGYWGHLVSSQTNDCVYLLLREHLGYSKAKRDMTILKEDKMGDWKYVHDDLDEILFVGGCVSYTLPYSALDCIQPSNSFSCCIFPNYSMGAFNGKLCIVDQIVRIPEEILGFYSPSSYFVKKNSVLIYKEKGIKGFKRLFFPPPV